MTTEPYECPFPVITVRSIGRNACTGCACEPGTCIFLPSTSFALFEAVPMKCSSVEVTSMWGDVFGGTDCVNSMVAFFGSWYFVGMLVSLVRQGAHGPREEEHALTLVQHLVRSGAQVNAPWMIGRTALFAAAWFGQPRMFKALLQLKADPTLRDESGCLIFSSFGRFGDRFETESELVVFLVHRRLPLALLWEYVDSQDTSDLHSFVARLIPRICSARAAILTVLVAQRAAPTSSFALLPSELIEHIVSYLCFSQTDAIWHRFSFVQWWRPRPSTLQANEPA